MSQAIPETDLEAFAAEFGASVEDDAGRVFNALERPVAKVAKPIEKPAPNPVEDALKALLEQAQKPLEVHLQAVAPPPAKVFLRAPPVQAPVSWRFTFERNADGTIREILATPAKE